MKTLNLRALLLRTLSRFYPPIKGKRRLTELALRRLKGLSLMKYRRDLMLALDLENYIDALLWVKGGFEESEIQFLIKLISENSCSKFLDVGANMGLYTLRVLRETAVESVIAFEPDPRNFAQLQTHLFINGLSDRCRVLQMAVSNHVGKLRFVLGRGQRTWDFERVNSGTSHVIRASDLQADEPVIEVPATTLDELFDWKGQRIALKIDVEGWELAVIEGAQKLLKDNLCLIQLELLSGEDSPAAMILLSMGYHKIMRNEESMNYVLGNFPVQCSEY